LSLESTSSTASHAKRASTEAGPNFLLAARASLTSADESTRVAASCVVELRIPNKAGENPSATEVKTRRVAIENFMLLLDEYEVYSVLGSMDVDDWTFFVVVVVVVVRKSNPFPVVLELLHELRLFLMVADDTGKAKQPKIRHLSNLMGVVLLFDGWWLVYASRAPLKQLYIHF
jgi:hypothetical protein